MDARFRFALKRPFLLTEHWPLDGYGAELSFEVEGIEARAIVVTFKNQRTDLAPSTMPLTQGPYKAQITIQGRLEALARNIARRFIDYANLYFSLEVDLDAMEAQYIPADEAERARMQLFSYSKKKERPLLHLPFDMLSQAFFAGEGGDDPSFPSRMSQLAREALIDGQNIDAFRYSFLLLEATYGDGKFKTKELARALCETDASRQLIEGTIDGIQKRPSEAGTAAVELIKAHSTVDALVSHLIDRRGFYFHGNLAHSKAWHPDRQDEARGLAEVGVDLAGRVAHVAASAMFTPEINTRFLKNAKSHGAIMQVEVHFRFIDQEGRQQAGRLDFEAPGLSASSDLVIKVNRHFLDWVEAEVRGGKLVSSVARIKDGPELFRSQYLLAADAAKKQQPNQTTAATVADANTSKKAADDGPTIPPE
jgi:hypothetical protein